MKTLLFIYNPKAGVGKIPGKLSDILDTFSYRGYLTTVCPTRAHGDATRMARELGGRYDRVVCCGGDGTLHETVAGLMELPQPPALGYIPAGTANDVSNNLGLPRDMILAASVAVSGDTLRCDMGRFNGAPYVYVAAFGAFTDVSYGTPQDFKNAFGHLAYILEGIGRLGSLRSYPMKVEYDGGVIEGDFIFGMVSNTYSVGGFNGLGGKDVQLDDGLFELVLVREPKNPADVQSILTSFVTQNPVEGGAMIGLRTSRARFTSPEPVAWTLDGEFGGEHTEAEAVNCRQALSVCYRPKS